mmetsp:Transcript_56059/g.87252  ORF Transcript_56059/g.87252 Transcript_56059/m.87252 type:complete len:486 (+) Transcript_56059:104-1561(+)
MATASVLDLKDGEDVDEYFFKAGYTDGYPVVIPTRSRVTRMLRGTDFEPTRVLGKCPPSYADVTTEKLAIAAVMAGCTPEMFRIVLAATQAMLKPEFNLHGVHATTMGATPVVLVNGPCRHQAGVNFQHGACSSGNRSHCICRALKLLMQNVGRAKLAGTESTTLGTPMKFGLCFAEWEERASMWEPLAVENGGAKRDEDAVTVLACAGGPTQLVDFNASPSQLIQRLAKLMAGAYSPHFPFINNVFLIISPEHYDTFMKAGLDSKAKLAKILWRETCKHMLPHLPWTITQALALKMPNGPKILFRIAGLIVFLIAGLMRLVGIPFLKIPKFTSPESFQIAVAGAPAGKFSCFMPGFGIGTRGMASAFMNQPVTARVEPRPASLDVPSPGPSTREDKTVLNPTSELSATLLSLAKRSGRVEGPVALMDISKARGSELLDVIEKKLHAQGVETRRYMKPTFSRPCPDELCQKIASECKSAVLGLAD